MDNHDSLVSPNNPKAARASGGYGSFAIAMLEQRSKVVEQLTSVESNEISLRHRLVDGAGGLRGG